MLATLAQMRLRFHRCYVPEYLATSVTEATRQSGTVGLYGAIRGR